MKLVIFDNFNKKKWTSSTLLNIYLAKRLPGILT